MSGSPSNEVLLEKMTNIIKSMDDGFKGIHERQDTTNGKVIKNTEHRIKTESVIGVFKWVIGVLGVGNIVLVFKIFG